MWMGGWVHEGSRGGRDVFVPSSIFLDGRPHGVSAGDGVEYKDHNMSPLSLVESPSQQAQAQAQLQCYS